MIVYEVNLQIQRAVEAEYRLWLDAHIREILALPGFLGAEVFELLDPPASERQLGLCVRYRLESEETLACYLREYAPQLRAEGQARFGGLFSAERRVMQSLGKIAASPLS